MISYLQVDNLSKRFGEQLLFENISFGIGKGQKVALIAKNGMGKSTLLRIIAGKDTSESGTVIFRNDITVGILDQDPALDPENSVFEEVFHSDSPVLKLIKAYEEAVAHNHTEALEKLIPEMDIHSAWDYDTTIKQILSELKIDTYDKKIGQLSGGQKKRVGLAKVLISNPDFLILDEPTNHLDIEMTEWLEEYLGKSNATLLMVTHDRYFLDRIAGKVIEIDQSKATTFMGNYSDYAVKKEQLRVAAWNAYMNQQREIKHQEEVIEKLKSFNREKSIKRAESREKMLDKIEVIEKPSEVRTDMKLTLTPRILSGNDVLTVEHLAKSFDSHKLFTDVNFEIKRGEHVAIIGDNGSGKTTLLKILNGLVPADQGTFRLGSNVEIGYYDQEHHVLHSDKTLFEEISDDYPYLNNTQIRNVLAAFLFTGEDVFKRISDLSGGERGRVSLAKLVLSNANFLILDEPTNHLDIMSKEILEDALNGYEGTILYVSHDRYFINRTAHRILDLTEGQFVNYVGNYDYYLEKHDTVMAAIEASVPQSADADNTVAAKVAESEVKLDWKAQKEEQARLRKKENDLKKCEEKIAELEARISEIDTEMSDPAIGTQVAKLQELSKEQAACQKQLEKLYEQWEELAE